MIPPAFVTEWSSVVPWPTPSQVEQDLVLSRLIVEIARTPLLGEELVFRGGTCLHKLFLGSARRYSEDLDYVRVSPGPIKPITAALTDLGEALGFEVRTQIRRFPKIVFRERTEDRPGMRVKIEINTHERSPARPHVLRRHTVNSRWFTGSARVLTFEIAELVGTKPRALYQRRKGRDLFDLWLALTELDVNPDEILSCFEPYRPAGLTAHLAVKNLRQKLLDDDFRSDIDGLVDPSFDGYEIDVAADLVIDTILSKL